MNDEFLQAVYLEPSEKGEKKDLPRISNCDWNEWLTSLLFIHSSADAY